MGEIRSLKKSSLIQSPKEKSGDLSGYSIHLADAASDSYEREFNLSLASRGQEFLNDLDEALVKIESGNYGRCELCNYKISEERLKAVPYAKLCLKCQQRQEKKRGRG